MKSASYVSMLRFSLAIVAASSLLADSYTFTTFNFPGATSTTPGGINDAGEVVGTYGLPNSLGQAFAYENGVFSSVNVPGVNGHNGTFSEASGVNNAGQIVGFYSLNAPGNVFGFIDSGGAFSYLNVGANTGAMGINNFGTIVGDSGLTTISGFVDAGGIITQFKYPGAADTFPAGINDSGVIAGAYSVKNGTTPAQGFVYEDGRFTSLSYPGALKTVITGINDAGDMVGTYVDEGSQTQSFIYSDGVYTTFAFPGAIATFLSGINNEGEVVGYEGGAACSNNALACGFVATPTPEPSGSTLMAFGVVAIGFFLRGAAK